MKNRKKKYHLKQKWVNLLYDLEMWLVIITVQVTVTLAIYWYLAGI